MALLPHDRVDRRRKMLIFAKYTALFRLLAPCPRTKSPISGWTQVIFGQPLNCKAWQILLVLPEY